MPFVVAPSKNKMLDTAWTAFKKERRAEKKASKAVEKPEVAPAQKAKKSLPAKKAATKRARRAK